MPPASPFRTIPCLLCGGLHLHPGPSYRNHLLHGHGVTIHLEFLVSVSNHLLAKATLPTIPDCDEAKAVKEVVEKEKVLSSQIECDLCEKTFTNETNMCGHVKECHQLSCEVDKVQVDSVKQVEEINRNVKQKGEADELHGMMINEKNTKSLPTTIKKSRPAINLASKSIKTCSLCQQKFLAQSKLMEHYQLKHKLRFRTETGQEQTFFISPQSDPVLTPGMAEQLGLSPVLPSPIPHTPPAPPPVPLPPYYYTPKPAQGTVTCNFCGKMFGNRRNMRVHMKRWCASRPDCPAKIPCIYCKKMFTNRETLSSHRKYYCHFRIGSQSETVNSQVIDHLGDKGQEGTEKVEDDTPLVEKEKDLASQFECDLCDELFKEKTVLLGHVKICHRRSCAEVNKQIGSVDNRVDINSNIRNEIESKSVLLEEDAGKQTRQTNEQISMYLPTATKKPRLSPINLAPKSSRKSSMSSSRKPIGEGHIPCPYCCSKFYSNDSRTRHLKKSCKNTPRQKTMQLF